MSKHKYIFLLPIISVIVIFVLFLFFSSLEDGNTIISGASLFLLIFAPFTFIVYTVIGFLVDKILFFKNFNSLKITKIITLTYFLFLVLITFLVDWNYSNRSIWILLSLPASVIIYFSSKIFFEGGMFLKSFIFYILPLNLTIIYYISYLVYSKLTGNIESNYNLQQNKEIINKPFNLKLLLYIIILIIVLFLVLKSY